MSRFTQGLVYGVSACLIWGVLPLYWKLVEEAGALEVLSHRGIWSLIFCFLFLALRRQIGEVIAIVRERRTLALLALAAGFLTVNWGVFIWSIMADRVVEAALGYYITPLMNVAFGVLLLREHLRRAQTFAVLLAAIGVGIITFAYGQVPLVALLLAISWGTYSLIKKRLNLGALQSLTIETCFAFLPNFAYLLYIERSGDALFGQELGSSLLLFSAGLATIIPLLLYNGATVRLPLSTMGMLQYLTPSMMLLVGVFLNGENMNLTKLAGFIFIWSALALLSRDLLRSSRTIDDSVAKAL